MFFFVLGHKKYSALLFYFLFLFTGFFLFFYNGKNLEKSFSLLAKEVKKGKKIEEDKKLSKKNILSLSSEEFRLLVASFGKKKSYREKTLWDGGGKRKGNSIKAGNSKCFTESFFLGEKSAGRKCAF